MPRTKCLNSTSFAPCGLVARPVKKHHNNLVLSMETVLASYRWKVGYLAWHLGISLLKRQIPHSGRSHEDLERVVKREVFFVMLFLHV